MRIETRARHNDVDRGLQDFIQERLESGLERFQHRIRRVDVYLHDVNGPRGGVDKQIRVIVHLHPRGQVVVAGIDASGYAAVADAVTRVKYAVARALRRHTTRRTRASRVLAREYAGDSFESSELQRTKPADRRGRARHRQRWSDSTESLALHD